MNVPGIVLHAASQDQLDALVVTPAHAVLLSGPVGIGKTHIAVALGAQLLKVSPETLLHHAYYRRITPTSGTITIEQVRELISFFKLKVPGKAPIKRLAIVEDAEVMGTEAQNALLKLLEEPPADSVLLLTSSRPDRLLSTIRSRLRQLQLPAPTEAALLEHFGATGYDRALIKTVLLRAGTSGAEVKRILETSGNESTETVALVKQVLGMSQYERLLLVDSLAKQKEQTRLFTETLAMMATASLEAAATKNAPTTSRWRDILQAAYTAQNALEQSGNAKLVLTELMLAI